MTQVSPQEIPRMPHKLNQKLQELTGLKQSTISKIIRKGDINHPVWIAYEKLLEEQVEAKAKEEREKLSRIKKVKKLQAQLAA